MLMGALKNSRASVRNGAWESQSGAATSKVRNLAVSSRLCGHPLTKADSMQKHVPSAPAFAKPLWVVVLSAGLIVGVALGVRQVMGLYLPPMTAALGIGVEPFSTSMAVAN